MTNKIRKQFKTRPKTGELMMLEGQRYELTAVTPHKRRDGEQTTLLTWESHCADCGQSFSVRTGLTIRGLNRRCDKHKSPGKTVIKKRQTSYRRWKRKAAN